MMENTMVRGTVLHSDVKRVPDAWCKLCRLVGNTKVRLARHSERMKTDPAYKEAVERLTELLPSRPGHAGESARIVGAGHALLIEVL